jgi:MFS family permease
MRLFFQRPILLYLCGGTAVSSAAVSLTQWLPAFFQRSHELSLAQAGGAVGLALLVAGPFGELLGGQISDRIGRRGTAGILYALVIISVGTAISGLVMVLAPGIAVALVSAVVWKILATAFPPPTWALSQSLVDVRMRATSQAFLGIFQNLLGYGAAPAIVGVLSELYRPSLGEESLRWAIATAMTLFAIAASAFYAAAARYAGKEASREAGSPQLAA